MSDKSDKRQSGDYGIGFGKTPEYTRFKPGQSGNPNGRPKKDRVTASKKAEPTQSELDEILRAEFDRTIAINEGGKPKKRNARELVARAQVNNALKGNPLSQQHVLKAIRDLESRDVLRAEALAEQREAKRQEDIAVYKYMINYKKEREAVWAEAEARGTEPDDPWPHPDDILLFPKTSTWRIRGPFDKSDVAYFNWCRAERNYLFAYRILDLALNKKRHQSWRNMWTLLWAIYDLKLPLRWQQIDKSEIPFFNLSILTNKKLEAHVEHLRREADFLSVLAGIPICHDKESYKVANTIMKPLLQQKGFHSLAEFEHAYETYGGNIPWVK